MRRGRGPLPSAGPRLHPEASAATSCRRCLHCASDLTVLEPRQTEEPGRLLSTVDPGSHGFDLPVSRSAALGSKRGGLPPPQRRRNPIRTSIRRSFGGPRPSGGGGARAPLHADDGCQSCRRRATTADEQATTIRTHFTKENVEVPKVVRCAAAHVEPIVESEPKRRRGTDHRASDLWGQQSCPDATAPLRHGAGRRPDVVRCRAIVMRDERPVLNLLRPRGSRASTGRARFLCAAPGGGSRRAHRR